jgi:RimJ/RimL family protein N-acetyltransferase
MDEAYRPFLETARLFLRPVGPGDVTERYCQWLNDPAVNAYLESRFRPTTMESLREFVATRAADRDTVFLAIVRKDGERHIGNIKLGPINWVHRFADVALMVGDKESWGQGFGSEAIGLVTRYAFGRLNLHKLTASCYASNLGSLKAFLKAGWVEEGVRRNQWFCDGRYEDGLQLAAWQQE